MFLKRICMAGFKSFAEKVDFDFAPGVTCIVGPNGCGKSNVVDAFKWVLGEQSARSLRGRQMTDMIFNGSTGRRSSSMAQVDLIFDNADRALNIDRDEVTITRKLFRSGESEYLVCKEAARLKDIREMFMDTGVGTNAYAVIEQGRVEMLLHSSPAERRIIFEEASGISKYRARRREAERKLDRTQQNLMRVADIIEEVEKRLRSVKLQAGKARNFKEYDARLRELRASFSMAEYHRLTQSIDGTQAEVDSCTDESTRLRTGIDQNEANAAELKRCGDRVEEQITVADNRLVSVRSEMTAHQERVDGAHSRIEEQRSNLERAERRCEQEKERREEHIRELDEVQEQAHGLQAATHKQNHRIEKLSRVEQELTRRVTQAQAILEDEKAGVIDLLRRTTQLHNEITSLAKHTENLSSQRGRLEERDAVIRSELQTLLERRGELENKAREVDELIGTETERLEEKKAAARLADAERARLVEELAGEKETRSGLRSRYQVLDDLQKKMEGIGAGVRRVLELKRRSADGSIWDNVTGLVADVFEADVCRAQVVEAALGGRDQQLVVRNSKEFLASPEACKALAAGATIIGLDRLGSVTNVGDFSEEPGFIASAIDFVRYPDWAEPLARTLLAKTVVVDTLSNALAMAGEDRNQHRFVTIGGEVVEPDGAVRIGPAAGSAGLISRLSELRSITEQLEEVDRTITKLEDDLNRTNARSTHLEKVQQELRTAIYELNTARIETKAALENVVEAVRRLTSEQPLIAGEVASIQQQIEEANEKSSSNKDSLVKLEADSAEREAKVAVHQERIDQLNERRARVGERLTVCRVAAGKLIEKRAAAAETINSLRRGIREAEVGVESAAAEMADCRRRIEDSEATIANCKQRLEELEIEATQIEEEAATLRRQREEFRAKIEELAAATKRLRSELETVDGRLGELRIALSETVVRRNELSARVQEELSLDLAALYEDYDHDEQDWEAVETEIAELKQKISRLGNINLDAITEQEELEERQTFLTSQRDDLEASRKQLDSLIVELDDESKRRFMETFEAIRENFRELFRKLFGGGKAEIILEDPENVLDCGIEIIARPPGKEQQSLMLLSGGEKAMTAIALLMSIFRSRPSPFAILDEVDAALDEANNERFNGIIQDFLDKSQFIVVTHSKRTMTIGDQMYGVTMQEPGVSTRVSVKFDRNEDSSSAVA